MLGNSPGTPYSPAESACQISKSGAGPWELGSGGGRDSLGRQEQRSGWEEPWLPIREPHRRSSLDACPKVTPKHHPAQDQIQPPAEVCSSWGERESRGVEEGGRQKEEAAARQTEGGGASQTDGARQQESVVSQSRSALYAARITAHWPREHNTHRPVPLPEPRTAIPSAAPANPAQKEGLLALLCWEGHFLSPACAKHHASVCPLLGPFF